MVLALAVEPLAAPSSVTLKPNTPLKTADVPAVACVLQVRNSYLCVLLQLLGFFSVLVSILRNINGILTVGEGGVFPHVCMCLPLESGKIHGFKNQLFHVSQAEYAKAALQDLLMFRCCKVI